MVMAKLGTLATSNRRLNKLMALVSEGCEAQTFVLHGNDIGWKGLIRLVMTAGNSINGL
jgi:hypothetical protein